MVFEIKPFEIKPKHIFSINNEKVIKNQILSVELQAKNVSVKKSWRELVYSEQGLDTSDAWKGLITQNQEFLHYFQGFEADNKDYRDGSFSMYKDEPYEQRGFWTFFVASGCVPFVKSFHFSIPRKTMDRLITKMYSGVDENGENLIQNNVTYRHEKYECVFTISQNGETNSQNLPYYSLISASTREMIKGEISSVGLPSETISTTIKYGNDDQLLSAVYTPYTGANVSTALIKYNSKTDNYECDIRAVCGLAQFRAKLELNFGVDEENYPETLVVSRFGVDYNNNETGYLDLYIPITIDFSFYGDTISLNVQEEKLVVGIGGEKKTYSVSDNELLQTSNSGITLQEAFGKTIAQQKDGKETAVILCSVENPRNDTEKMLYEIGDQVIPYVPTAQQQERPMSSYADGKPKVFNVLGTNVFYDGAVWQELTLQEATDYYTESEV